MEKSPHALDEEPVIKVDGLSKTYDVWTSPKAILTRPMLQFAARKLPMPSALRARLEASAERMYREFHALRDISFEIKKGESWGFIGVNGSGKSTLLKIISGNLVPSAGEVTVRGKVAILDFGSGFSAHFTGRENVYLKAAIHGLSKREVDRRFDSITAFADIGEFIEQPVRTYSSGMAARLGFAIMAHIDADTLITDEALAVGDAFFVQKCMKYIRGFLNDGTFLFVSHAVNDVVALCDKAVWLENGHVRAIGDAREVTDAYISSATLRASKQFLLADEPVEDHNASDEDMTLVEGGGWSEREYLRSISQPRLSALTNSKVPRKIRDGRLDVLNSSPWRNDIELTSFELNDPGFGVGGAKIEDVAFEDESGAQLTWIVGAEQVTLRITVLAERELRSPIVGFQIKDRLGQVLFADNTYLTTLDDPIQIKWGDRYLAEFRFQMPLLPVGEYVIRAATALGEEDDNAMLHCIDSALVFNSMTSGARHGLIGVPMKHVKLVRCLREEQLVPDDAVDTAICL